MESQPQNPEFRNNPESFNPCLYHVYGKILTGQVCDQTFLIISVKKSSYFFKLVCAALNEPQCLKFIYYLIMCVHQMKALSLARLGRYASLPES